MGALLCEEGTRCHEEEEDEKGATCRVCWETDAEERLCSPCKCIGTQKHVHLECLRRWQLSLQKRDATDERAFRCSVCRALFSVPPPRARRGTLVLQALRGLGGMLCVSLLALLSGPPWPHLALVILLLLGSRSHWLPGLALLALGSLMVATLHLRGMRVVLRLDGGGRLGLALIRHGPPVQGVAPGVVLVAAEGLDHSIFRRSVVLLTQHGRGGTRGVLLSQPMAHPPALPAGHRLEAAPGGGNATGGAPAGPERGRGAGDGRAPIKHYLGGPVGMPGEGIQHAVTILHSMPAVPGARRILPHANTTGGGEGGGTAPGGVPAKPALYEGGSLGDIVRAAEAAADSAGSAGRGQWRRKPPAGPPVLLFHGACHWSEGQLEGELRAGAWAFADAAALAPDLPTLLELPPEELWQALAGSPALVRLE